VSTRGKKKAPCCPRCEITILYFSTLGKRENNPYNPVSIETIQVFGKKGKISKTKWEVEKLRFQLRFQWCTIAMNFRPIGIGKRR
jgi:hypothetical protein